MKTERISAAIEHFSDAARFMANAELEAKRDEPKALEFIGLAMQSVSRGIGDIREATGNP